MKQVWSKTKKQDLEVNTGHPRAMAPVSITPRTLPYLIRNAAAHLHLPPRMFSIKNVIFHCK
jgi:hypothetical protein